MSASRRDYLPLILAAACWGLGTVTSKRAVAEIPPLTLLPIQLGSSLALLVILMRLRGVPFRDAAASPVLGRLGVLNPGIAYALSLLGLVTITASLSVMLWALEPLLILFLSVWFLRERVTPSLVLLSLVAVGGMLLVIYQPGSTGSPIGVLLTVAGVGCCAVYSVITRKWISTSDSTTQVVVAQQAYALALAFVLVLAAWVLGGAVRPEAVSPIGIASAIGSGVLYYGIAYWLYLTGLRRVPASIAAASFYLIPIFGVAGGFMFLGERLQPTQWISGAIVLAAIGVILWRTTASHWPSEHRRLHHDEDDRYGDDDHDGQQGYRRRRPHKPLDLARSTSLGGGVDSPHPALRVEGRLRPGTHQDVANVGPIVAIGRGERIAARSPSGRVTRGSGWRAQLSCCTSDRPRDRSAAHRPARTAPRPWRRPRVGSVAVPVLRVRLVARRTQRHAGRARAARLSRRAGRARISLVARWAPDSSGCSDGHLTHPETVSERTSNRTVSSTRHWRAARQGAPDSGSGVQPSVTRMGRRRPYAAKVATRSTGVDVSR